MCDSNSEAENTLAFNYAMSSLQNRPNRNKNTEMELTKFANEKACYAHYVLSNKKGSRGRHVSSLEEAKHSSAVTFW